VNRAGCVVVEMGDFGARDQKASDYCRQMVQRADVLVAIVGLRYGTPVRDRPELSYTELEFETATQSGIPRLMFLLDEQSALPLPASQLIDHEHGSRQFAFRRHIEDVAGVIAVRVSTAQQLGAELYHALVELVRRDQYGGLERVHERFPDEVFIRYVESARRVTILNTWIPNLVRLRRALAGALERRAEVRALLLYPYSDLAGVRDRALRTRGVTSMDGSVNVTDGVERSLKTLASIAGQVDAEARASLQVKVYNSQPSIAVYRADEHYLVSMFMHGQLAIQSPQFEISGADTVLGSHVQDELETLWTIGYDVDPLDWSGDLSRIEP
jgi:uncharacterized protein DUF4062